ncbi:hypothetical protein FRC06_007661 [Ceratobasidium sp. 370]|nr:hypothetical protein FRC06_007661 [Ceratobasidium sp. 370]
MSTSEIEWIRIKSGDGFSFLVDKKVVECSVTLRDMLDASSGFAEAQSKTCSLQYRPGRVVYSAAVVEKVVEYLNFHYLYKEAKPQDIPDFRTRIPPELALEL